MESGPRDSSNFPYWEKGKGMSVNKKSFCPNPPVCVFGPQKKCGAWDRGEGQWEKDRRLVLTSGTSLVQRVESRTTVVLESKLPRAW
jgi:hypothetical protein